MTELEMVVMNLIINAGDAKASAYEALEKVNEGKYEEANELMEKADEALEVAHNAQTSLLQKEAAGSFDDGYKWKKSYWADHWIKKDC